MLYLSIIAIFISVALLCAVILYPILTRRSALQERLDNITPQYTEQIRTSLIREKTPFQNFLTRIGNFLPEISTRTFKIYTGTHCRRLS